MGYLSLTKSSFARTWPQLTNKGAECKKYRWIHIFESIPESVGRFNETDHIRCLIIRRFKINIRAFICRPGLLGFIYTPSLIGILFPTSCDKFPEASLRHLRVSVSYPCSHKTSAGWNLIQTFWPVLCPVICLWRHNTGPHKPVWGPVQSWGYVATVSTWCWNNNVTIWQSFEYSHYNISVCFLKLHLRVCAQPKVEVKHFCLSYIMPLVLSFLTKFSECSQ